MRTFNSHEALAILKEYNITKSIQMVTQWLREGKIKAERTENRKDGYLICEEDLYDFIEEKRPGWTGVMAVYDDYVDQLDPLGKKEAPMIKEAEFESTKLQDLEIQFVELDEHCHNLEYKIQELLQENDNLKEENNFLMEFCDIQMDEVSDLTQKYNELNQEFSSLKTMYVALMDEYTKTDQKSAAPSEKPKKKLKKPIENAKEKLAYKDFYKIVEEVKKELNTDCEIEEEEQKDLYLTLFLEDELIKSECMNDAGEFLCPYTHKSFKQKKRFVKSAVTHFMNSKAESSQDVPQMSKEKNESNNIIQNEAN